MSKMSNKILRIRIWLFLFFIRSQNPFDHFQSSGTIIFRYLKHYENNIKTAKKNTPLIYGTLTMFLTNNANVMHIDYSDKHMITEKSLKIIYLYVFTMTWFFLFIRDIYSIIRIKQIYIKMWYNRNHFNHFCLFIRMKDLVLSYS